MNAVLEQTDCQECEVPSKVANAVTVLVKPSTSRWAVAGAVVAFASFVIWGLLHLATPLLGAVAAVFGLVAKMRIRRNPERLAGRTWAGIAIGGGFLNILLLLGLFYFSGARDRERYQFAFYG